MEEPVYQVLQAKGNFKSFLACVDKAGYKDVLSKAGYWTIFAPNDEAFQLYFQDAGIAGVEAMDAATAEKIVKYAMVYNAFKTDRLADYQSGLGWKSNQAYKRRTAYYEGVQRENINGAENLVVASNRNNRSGSDYYNVNDNNNKYIPYFLNKYFNARGLTAYDYNYFYPNTPFTGFNVGGAKIVTWDIIAENGVVHELDKVITPLPNLDKYLASQNRYSKFRSIFEKYMVSYLVNAPATEKYNLINGGSNNVYVKVYDAGLMYSPNNENYLKFEDNDGQQEGYTLFAPTNEALDAYLKNVLLEHYPTLDDVPKQIIYDFLNAHMWNMTVWPSKFQSTHNSFGQGALFNPETDVVDKKVLSNGMFYGTSKVQEANVFSSVFGKVYLDPKYSLMTRALTVALKPILINTSIKFTVFLASDEVVKAAGFDYNLDANRWEYTPPGGGAKLTGTSAWDKLNRIINAHVALGDFTNVTTGNGVIETYNGEYIRFSQNSVFSAGNLEKDMAPGASNQKVTSNGTVYYVDQLFLDPQQAMGLHLKKLAEQPDSPYKKFYDYLSNAAIYTPATGALLGVADGSFYTLLAPDNAAIDAAVAEGYLPAATNPSENEDKEKVANFIRYHIISKAAVAADGKKEGGYLTILDKENGEATMVAVTNTPGSMTVRDMKGGTARVITASSNNVSNRAVIHLLDDFLRFDTK
ncbi:fasciclin domain-containing protein [Botryobacter ruber]|uniref:fasciclin domain-containing protein n=1 Tax=Botryobacter ruber TaxID=2171629 RepID=UPI0013E3C4E8|nr:fasciclin domain-containing protein [Botryobacter ruber]